KRLDLSLLVRFDALPEDADVLRHLGLPLCPPARHAREVRLLRTGQGPAAADPLPLGGDAAVSGSWALARRQRLNAAQGHLAHLFLRFRSILVLTGRSAHVPNRTPPGKVPSAPSSF